MIKLDISPLPAAEDNWELLLDTPWGDDAGGMMGELAEKLRLMEQEVLDAAAHEQARMAEELHDGLCQRLTTLSVLLATLGTRLTAVEDAQAHMLLGRASDLARQAIAETRALAHSLYPAVIGEEGLAGALADLASNLEAAHGLPCTLEIPVPVDFRDAQAGRHLYRIAQEAASNALRHGLPTYVAFRLMLEEGALVLCIENDGATIDPRAAAGGGIGLRTMRRRAGVMGGSLEVQPRNPGGTIVTCRVPWQEA